MQKYLIHFILIIIYFVLGAYATTDVSRLLKGATTPISDPYCYCPSCGSVIPLRSQLPIISFMINKGKCTHCHNMISLCDILPEIILPAGFIFFSYFFYFTLKAYFSCMFLFEAYKFVSIVYYKPRETAFFKNLMFSLVINIFLFVLLGFFFFLANIL